MSSPNQLSFLPEDYLETKRQQRTNIICAGLFIVIMLVVGVTYFMDQKAYRAVEKEHAEVGRRHAEAANLIEQERQLREKQLKMNTQANLTASLLERVPRSVLLAELANAKPAGVSFLELSLDSKVHAGSAGGGGPKSQFEIKRAAMEAANGGGGKPSNETQPAKLYDVTVKVTGVADNDSQVAQFMAALNRSKLVRDVNLLISDEFIVAEIKMRKFQVDMSVDPGAEVQPGAIPSKTASTTVELK
jgi:Tfp pilus assembly protein PilN